MATSAIELSDCRIRRAKMVVVGSMVSSLSLLSGCEPRCSVTSALLSYFGRPFTALDRFYLPLSFKHKRNLSGCDVQFVPNVATGHGVHDLKQMPPFGDALPHLPGRIDFATMHFGGTIRR